MKWTSAAFGVRFPDADGAAGPEPCAGAGAWLLPALDALLHAEASATMLTSATVVDRSTVFIRRSPGHRPVRNVQGPSEKRISGHRGTPGKQLTAAEHRDGCVRAA